MVGLVCLGQSLSAALLDGYREGRLPVAAFPRRGALGNVDTGNGLAFHLFAAFFTRQLRHLG